VDNGSSDGSAHAIASEFPDVHLLLEENIGFAAANNKAVRHAAGARLLLLNPDTVVMDGAIDRIWEFAECTKEAGIWGGRTLFADGSLNPTSCWGRMTPWSLFCRAVGLTYLRPRSRVLNSEALGNWPRDTEREVDIVTGCFFLVDHELWRHLGGFNPDFFMYGEEADLCLRAHGLGARPRITPTATIIHHGGGAEVSSADKLIKVLRAKVTLMNLHWSPFARVLGRLMFLVLVTIRAGASVAVDAPRRSGVGMDHRPDIWRVAFKRRAEWLAGWPSTPPTG